jgi:hypothetical protein
MSILSAEEDYVDDFNSFTVESASKYINFNKSAEALFDDDLKSLPNTETYIPGTIYS